MHVEPMIKKVIFLYTVVLGSAQPIIDQATETATVSWLPTVLVSIFMLISILPELLLVWPTYRNNVLQGIQDGDGVTNANDLRFFISWYGPFSALRGIIFMALFSMVAEYDPPQQILWALIAVGTGTALPHLKDIITKRNSPD